jgi:hypothetical protein
MNNQNNYKAYLDHQNQTRLSPVKNEQADQLILPAYHYLNKPQPTNRKALDSIELVKKNALFDRQDRFFTQNAQYETLIDYGKSLIIIGERNYYLGDTRLKHNPITCPINDGEYNKYLAKMKNNTLFRSHDNTLASAGNKIFV